MAQIKLLVHAADVRDAASEARRRGVRRSEMVWCQSPQGLRGLSAVHLKNMRAVVYGPCDSEMCDESMAHLRRIGVAV